MEKFEFYERMKPHIERAAEVAKRRASSVITNGHLLWTVYQNEKLRLHFATWEFNKNETVKPSPHLDEMTREEFEQYLLNLGVWVEESDEEKN